jgi:ABC-type transport system involved in multi-copper enzyme maturation permease subunit
MLKALVIKELRESAGIIALAALAAVFVVTSLTGLPLVPVDAVGSGGFPFVSDTFTLYLGLILGGLAAALGLKQTAWESSHGTYHFLLHRPVSRQFVFGTKLAVGVATILMVGGLMILAYAMWAAGAGNSPTPFAWSMTAPAWQLLLCLPLIYLGAFLSGLRPARWFGTRLGPLASGIIVAIVVSWMYWWWLVAALLAVFAVIGLTAIFQQVMTRDY